MNPAIEKQVLALLTRHRIMTLATCDRMVGHRPPQSVTPKTE